MPSGAIGRLLVMSLLLFLTGILIGAAIAAVLQRGAISSDTLRQVSVQMEKLAAAQREADRATAAGELGKRTEEIRRSLDPIARNLERVSGEVARLEQDRRTTHGQVRQMFESMSAEVGRLRDQTGTLVTALKRPQVR